MSDEIVNSDNLSKDLLKNLFENAYMNVSSDKDGDVIIKEGGRGAYAFVDKNKRFIHLVSFYSGNPKASLADKLMYVNKVMANLILSRSYVDKDGDIIFDYYIPVEGGTTKRGVVLATKRFFSVLDDAIQEDDKDVIA
jgi:hypothetical protein